MFTFSREELHLRAWAEPIPALAASLGVRATRLRQACRDTDVPLPGPGYWTRLRAGKPVAPTPLPPRGPAKALRITLAAPGRDGVDAWKAELAAPLPEPPVFDEPVDALRARLVAQIGPIHVPPNLERPCRDIRRLLAADDRRRAAGKAGRASPGVEAPLFDTPFERRRLRILNALAFAFGRVGTRLDIGGHAGRDHAVLVGRQQVGFTLDAPFARPGPDGAWSVRPGPEGPLALGLLAEDDVEPASATWTDQDSAPLEVQLTAFATELLVVAETRYRRAEAATHANRIARRVEIAANLAARQADAVRRRDEREALKAEARRQRLLGLAQDWRGARDIRAFVAEVIGELGDAPDPDGTLADWRAWALAEADDLDPALRGDLVRWSADDDDAFERPCGCGARCERDCGCGLRSMCECDCPGEQDRDDEFWLRFPEP